MSYDLYFTKPPISPAQFREYFLRRRHCKVSGSQMHYQNEDTGVYFLINHEEPKQDSAESISCTASLNLNYYRSHVFGLEAAEVIAAFVKHFGLSIDDPQAKGMGGGPFEKEGFRRAWNHGNEFGYAAILKGENAPKSLFTYPGDRLEKIWRWNFTKTSILESFAEDRFVPRIFFVDVGGKAVSVAVWPDAISELVPHVDYLIVGRDELAPKPFFGEKKKDRILVPMGELVKDLETYATSDYPVLAYKLPAPSVPEPLRNRIRKLKANGVTAQGLAFDQILDEEIVSKCRMG